MKEISQNAMDLLKRKNYFQKGERTWSDICRRVAKNIASAEEDEQKRACNEERFFTTMLHMDFLPSTPALLNAGTKAQQLSSCFILDIDDSIDSIMNTLAESAKIFQKSGGCGFNISALRPAGSPLSNSGGYASGPISFMRLFNQLVEEVKHGNSRKGAIKIDLDVSHPDIFDFIHCKDDTTQLNNMNISVSISDDFMTAVLNDEDWALHFKGKVHRTVKAEDLWNEIITSAWKTGEPGLTFIDVANRYHMNPQLGEVKGSNPCLHKDTYMVTENGLERISNLKSRIWNGNQYSESKAWQTGIKKVVRLMTKSGFEYVVTPDHKFMMEDGSWCEAQHTLGKNIKFELSEKKWIGYDPYPGTDYRILGFVLGDGSYHKASNRMKYLYITDKKDAEVEVAVEQVFNDKFYTDASGKKIIKIPYGTVYANAFENRIENRQIPDWIMQLPKEQMKDFLKGLFSANGCNLKKYRRVTLVSINKEMLQQVQQMLLMFGVKAKLWYHSKKQEMEFSNGVYSKQSCHLAITRDSYKRFLDNIGFMQEYKNGYERYTNKEEILSETVILISELDDAEVWDFTEPINHYGVTNGAIVHNCQEFINIPYSSCNLGSVNLANMVLDGKLDYTLLENTIRTGVRFIDNMISVNKLPLPKIQEVTELLRPVGLGTMGLADMMFKLRIPMNSEKGIKFIDELYFTIKRMAVDESMRLAEEKGVYPGWKGSVWEAEGKHMRNGNILSIAPNGSIGFIANVNGGIEPVFALVYTRLTAEGHPYHVVNEAFKEALQEEGLLNDEVLEAVSKNNGSVKGLDIIPKWMQEVFVTASDMTPMEHIRCLDAVSKHVDLSVSKTINMPNSATVDDVSKVYMAAWQSGNIKGTTVYRDGSRQFQVLSTSSSKENETAEPENPSFSLARGDWSPIAEDTVYYKRKVDIGCGKLTLMIGWSEAQQCIQELYVIRSGQGGCERNLQGMVIAMSGMLRLGGSLFNIEKAFSGVGACTSFVTSRIKGQKVSSGSSCGMAILNEIKAFLRELDEGKPEVDLERMPIDHLLIQVVKSDGSECPECGKPMRTEGGCLTCPDCGNSLCG